MEKILQIDNLQKSFRSNWTFKQKIALKNVNLSVNKGDVFGFLGQNGAGKTTTIKCILGFIREYRGHIFFNGEIINSTSLNNQIGYLPELPYFYDYLSVKETMYFFASLYGISANKQKTLIEQTIENLELKEHYKKAVSKLSKGLKQKLGFAQAILNSPKLLILDEPFSGLDPLARSHLKTLMHTLNQGGTTIFMSSHILSDVEEICNRVCILKSGEVKSCFYLNDIPDMENKCYEIVFSAKNAQLDSLKFKNSPKKINDTTYQLSYDCYQDAELAVHQIIHAKMEIMKFAPLHTKLEEIYIKINKEPNENF